MSFLAGVLGVDRTYAAITIAIIVFIAIILRNVLVRVRENLLSKVIGGTHIRAD